MRGRGGSAQLDFGRGIVWRETTGSDNPIFEAYGIADALASQARRQARQDLWRRLSAALAKRPDANPFEESLYRSIRAFYANGPKKLDARHDPHLGIERHTAVRGCCRCAGVGTPSRGNVQVAAVASAPKPTVLVVGGGGFIGRRLVRALLERGHGVRVLTRNPRAAALEFEGLAVDLYQGSHGDAECVARALDGIEVVYHLAKCEGKRWQDYVAGDIEPTRVLAEASLAAGIKRFIYTGTIASYASDDARNIIDNRTPLDPAIARRNHYARSKAACEALLQGMRRDRGLPLVILRPAIVIGPGARRRIRGSAASRPKPEWTIGATADRPLPLVLVDDVADALARALDAPDILGQTLLVTSPPLLNAREYVAAVAQCMQARIDARPRAAWRYWAADMVKELAKNAVRHPNRRWPSLHDWRCQSHSARYDSRMTQQALGWAPVGSADDRPARNRGGCGVVSAVISNGFDVLKPQWCAL